MSGIEWLLQRLNYVGVICTMPRIGGAAEELFVPVRDSLSARDNVSTKQLYTTVPLLCTGVHFQGSCDTCCVGQAVSYVYRGEAY